MVDDRRIGAGNALEILAQVTAGVDNGEGHRAKRGRLNKTHLLGKPVISVYRKGDVDRSFCERFLQLFVALKGNGLDRNAKLIVQRRYERGK